MLLAWKLGGYAGVVENMVDITSRDRTRQTVLRVPIDAFTMSQAIERCRAAMQNDAYLSIGVVNAAKIMAMRHNAELRQAVNGCHMITADGQSVVWASRLLGTPLPERVAGIDLFAALLAEAERCQSRVYFLGARPEILARMLDRVADQFPGLQVAGARDGYFAADEEAEIVAEIRRTNAKLLFVGMSSPRKELFLDRWGEATAANVVHGVGGSFDVLAGLTRRAPVWYQEHGLEWLYRVRQEPLRLGRRYLTTNISFLALLAREMLLQRVAGHPPGGSATPPVRPDDTSTSGAVPSASSRREPGESA